MVGQFPELESRPNVCTDVQCFRLKTQEWARMKLEEAKKAGKPVLEAGQAFRQYGGVKEGLVDLSETCEPLGWENRKAWKAALGKDVPEVILAVDKEGKLHELVKKEEAVKVLKDSGKLKKAREASGSNDNWRKEQARKAKLGKLYAAAAIVATGELVKWLARPEKMTKAQALGVAQAMAWSAYDHTSIDEHAFVAKGRGLTTSQSDCREKLEKWIKENQADASALTGFAVELLLCCSYEGGGYRRGKWENSKGWSASYRELCELAGLKLPVVTLAADKKAKAAKKAKKGGK
jgi:hypothetical protein